MITITLKGMDTYQAIYVTGKIHKNIAEVYGVNDDELEFYAIEGFIIHDGIEQTSFRLNIDIEAPEKYASLEGKVKEALVKGLKDVAIHFHIIFRYFQPEHEYLVTDDTYPLYMTDNNTVKAVVDDQEKEKMEDGFVEEGEEPYMGDILGQFDTYVKDHPNASNKEIYEALAGIRKRINDEHNDEEGGGIEEESLEEEDEEEEEEDKAEERHEEEEEEQEQEDEDEEEEEEDEEESSESEPEASNEPAQNEEAKPAEPATENAPSQEEAPKASEATADSDTPKAQ